MGHFQWTIPPCNKTGCFSTKIKIGQAALEVWWFRTEIALMNMNFSGGNLMVSWQEAGWHRIELNYVEESGRKMMGVWWESAGNLIGTYH